MKLNFYGRGESDGDFSEMRYMDEAKRAKAIYLWASEQPWRDRGNMLPAGHSMEGVTVSNIIPQLQPRGTVVRAPGDVVYYDISSRVHAVPSHYEELYDIDRLMMPSEFLSQMRKTDIARQAGGYGKKALIIHGELDREVPVYTAGPYLDLYGEKACLEIIKGANRRFTSVEWKDRVYELNIDYIEEKVGSTEKYLLED